MRPFYFGDIATCSSQVEKFGNSSFVVRHSFRRGDEPDAFASGHEVRVWGYSKPEEPEQLLAVRVPDEVRALLSVDGSVDVTP